MAINNILRNRNLLETLSVRVESPSKVYTPLVRDQIFDVDGIIQSFSEYAKDNKTVLSIQNLLEPIRAANEALGRYVSSDERDRVLAPYVSRALHFSEPAAKQTTKQAPPTVNKSPTVKPQEGNIAFAQTTEFFNSLDSVSSPSRTLDLSGDEANNEGYLIETTSGRTAKKRGATVDVSTAHLLGTRIE